MRQDERAGTVHGADGGGDAVTRGPDKPGEDDPGPGRRIGVDVGSVRVGVAMSDPSPMLASPLQTLRRSAGDGSDVAQLAELVTEHDVVEVVVGLPRTLADRHGSAAEEAVRYAGLVRHRIAPVPVRMADERLSTVSASRMLSARGMSAREQRAVVDQAAAVEILQGWLDARSARIDRSGTGGAASRPAGSSEE
ncbi:putative holliday junction resolvase [Haloechinothrix alba]|uniref:Putative pre-16S rRNA nuclease n=1 Tax=Haloechinothrix alba TaxID=664784 RepID=A0A238WYH0_9PSEU|nr:putative holliday junction resolvase [Haloechinothrix alba]